MGWFQSTHLREVRQYVPSTTTTIRTVSIHAPTRGATSCGNPESVSARFQSTHLREVRPEATFRGIRVKPFQSTHLREVRPPSSKDIKPITGFNPRTYERCDFVHLDDLPVSFVFQSTHLREVRREAVAVFH